MISFWRIIKIHLVSNRYPSMVEFIYCRFGNHQIIQLQTFYPKLDLESTKKQASLNIIGSNLLFAAILIIVSFLVLYTIVGVVLISNADDKGFNYVGFMCIYE